MVKMTILEGYLGLSGKAEELFETHRPSFYGFLARSLCKEEQRAVRDGLETG
jgi:hypothetical protein